MQCIADDFSTVLENAIATHSSSRAAKRGPGAGERTPTYHSGLFTGMVDGGSATSEYNLAMKTWQIHKRKELLAIRTRRF